MEMGADTDHRMLLSDDVPYPYRPYPIQAIG